MKLGAASGGHRQVQMESGETATTEAVRSRQRKRRGRHYGQRCETAEESGDAATTGSGAKPPRKAARPSLRGVVQNRRGKRRGRHYGERCESTKESGSTAIVCA